MAKVPRLLAPAVPQRSTPAAKKLFALAQPPARPQTKREEPRKGKR